MFIHQRRLLVARYFATITCILSSVGSCAMHSWLPVEYSTFNFSSVFTDEEKNVYLTSKMRWFVATHCMRLEVVSLFRSIASPVSNGWQFFMQMHFAIVESFFSIICLYMNLFSRHHMLNVECDSIVGFCHGIDDHMCTTFALLSSSRTQFAHTHLKNKIQTVTFIKRIQIENWSRYWNVYFFYSHCKIAMCSWFAILSNQFSEMKSANHWIHSTLLLVWNCVFAICDQITDTDFEMKLKCSLSFPLRWQLMMIIVN